VPAGPPGRRGFSLRTFESLKHQPFRWFFLSSLGAMASLNMQILVRGFLAFELTDSFSALGAIGLASAMPMLVLSVVGGVLADRVAKKRVLQVGQAISAVMAIAIGVLVASGQLRFEHLFVASLLQGVMMAIMMPASQAIVPEVIGRKGMMNAVSLNAAGMNFVRLLAPAAGGYLIALVGAGSAYFLMAGLYGLSIAALVRVPNAPALVPAGPGEEPRAAGRLRDALRAANDGRRDLVAGIRYIVNDANMFQLLAMNFVTSMLGLPFMVMLPGYVREVYGGGADDLGLLIGISGCGRAGRRARRGLAAGAASRAAHAAVRDRDRRVARGVREHRRVLDRRDLHGDRGRRDGGAPGARRGAVAHPRRQRLPRARHGGVHDADQPHARHRLLRRAVGRGDRRAVGARQPRRRARGRDPRLLRLLAAAAAHDVAPRAAPPRYHRAAASPHDRHEEAG
jgi:MFS family permease